MTLAASSSSVAGTSRAVSAAVLIACLHIICDCKFSRESLALCALNKALWSDHQHLRAICRLKYSITCAAPANVFEFPGSIPLQMAASRLAAALCRGPGTHDKLAAERARTLIEQGGCNVGSDELALACKSRLHEALAVIVAHPGLEPSAINSPSAALATTSSPGGQRGGLPMAPLSYAALTGDAAAVALLLSHAGTDPTVLGPGQHHRLLDFLDFAGGAANIKAMREAFGSAGAQVYVEGMEARYRAPLETTPLGLAALHGSTAVCALLLADPRVDPNAGQLDESHDEAVLNLPPLPIAPGTAANISPLHLALSRANGQDVVRVLLEHASHKGGVDINALDEQGLTATAKAALHGLDDALALLIAAGADLTLGSLSLGASTAEIEDTEHTATYITTVTAPATTAAATAATTSTTNNGNNNVSSVLLQRVVLAGHSACALLLLDHPACGDINTVDGSRHTRLAQPAGLSACHAACMKGMEDVAARLLLRPDLHVNAKSGLDGAGPTAIRLALLHRHPTIVKMLLTHTDIDLADALESACELGLSDTVTQLLSRAKATTINEGDANVKPFSPAVLSRALFRACIGRTLFPDFAREDDDCNYADTVSALLSTPGLDVNAFQPVVFQGGNASPRTALSVVVESSQCDLVRLLASAPGIRVQPETLTLLLGPRCQALLPSCQALLPSDLAELVVRAPIDMTRVQQYWQHVEYASMMPCPRLIAKLFECYGVVRYEPWPAYYNSPLYTSCRWGREANVKIMLTHPDIHRHLNNGAAEEGWTPLIAASRGGHLEIVEMLVRTPGLDPNATDRDGFTALTWAAHEGWVDILALLLTLPGIDLEAESRFLGSEGFTAHSFAREWGDSGHMAKMLEDAGARRGPSANKERIERTPGSSVHGSRDEEQEELRGHVGTSPYVRFCEVRRAEGAFCPSSFLSSFHNSSVAFSSLLLLYSFATPLSFLFSSVLVLLFH